MANTMGKDNQYECGTTFEVPDFALLEEGKQITLYCRKWRECSVCLNHRIDEFLQAARDALEHLGELKMIGLSESRSREFVRKTDSDNYIRFPAHDRVWFIYTRTDFADEAGFNLVESNLNRHMFKKLVSVKERKRTSGNLFKRNGDEAKKEQDSILVRQEIFSFRNEDQERAGEAWNLIAAQTVKWNVNEDNIHSVINTRTTMYKKALSEAGIKILGSMVINRRIKHSKLDAAKLTPIEIRNPSLQLYIERNRRYFLQGSESVWDELLDGLLSADRAKPGIFPPT